MIENKKLCDFPHYTCNLALLQRKDLGQQLTEAIKSFYTFTYRESFNSQNTCVKSVISCVTVENVLQLIKNLEQIHLGRIHYDWSRDPQSVIEKWQLQYAISKVQKINRLEHSPSCLKGEIEKEKQGRTDQKLHEQMGLLRNQQYRVYQKLDKHFKIQQKSEEKEYDEPISQVQYLESVEKRKKAMQNSKIKKQVVKGPQAIKAYELLEELIRSNAKLVDKASSL